MLIPLSKYIQAVDLLLINNAAVWAKTALSVINIVFNPYLTQSTVNNLKALIIKKYPAHILKPVMFSYDTDITNLKQRLDEALSFYYKRASAILKRVDAKD